jgi:hypothetical protein
MPYSPLKMVRLTKKLSPKKPSVKIQKLMTKIPSKNSKN